LAVRVAVFTATGGAQMLPKATTWLVTAVGCSVAAYAVEDSTQGFVVKNSLTWTVTLPADGFTEMEKACFVVSGGAPGPDPTPVTWPVTVEPAGALA
jgi:hypothetical protein